MILNKLEVQIDSDDCSKSDNHSFTSESSSDYQNDRNRGRTEPKKKMNSRSTKLSRFHNFMQCTRPAKSPSGHHPSAVSGYTASSASSASMDSSDSSSDSSKASSCSESSDANKENFQKSEKGFASQTSLRSLRSIKKLSSMRLRRPLLRKFSGGTDLKNKPNKLANEISRPSKRDAKALAQASPRNSDSSLTSNSKQDSVKNESVKSVSRTTSLRPLRVLTKVASLRSRRVSMKNCPQDSSLNRATCSSALKESKLKVSDQKEIQPGRSESDVTSLTKVCTYSYCSLHGHRHGDVPPLKRFVSMRRRVLKTKQPESRLFLKTKLAGNKKKRTQTSKLVSQEDPAVVEKVDSSATSHVEDTTSVLDLNAKKSVTDGEKKSIGFWNIIYRHMVTGIAAESETQLPHDGLEKEKQVEDVQRSVGMSNIDSCVCLPAKLPKNTFEDSNPDSPTTDQRKFDAIKLVQDAFDKILAEIPDICCDDRSITSDVTSEQEITEKKDNGKEIQNGDEKGVNADTSKEEKEAAQPGDNSNQKTPKSWSNLKKIIILKRFVKAMEKVRNFNPRTPRYLPVEPDPEAEKVHLKHQTVEGRKNSEEWMLDYALRQVISTLAPAQKRKVALLVQAFETVAPISEDGTPIKSDSYFSPPTPVQACSLVQSSVESGEEFGCESANTDMKKEELAVVKPEHEDKSCILTRDQHDFSDFSSQRPGDPKLCDNPSSEADNNASASCMEFPDNGEILREFSEKEISILNPEVSEGDIEKLESSSLIDANDDHSDKPESRRTDSKEQSDAEHKFLQRNSPVEEFHHNCATDPANKSQLEKQKYTRLWYLIYKHMVSSNDPNNGTQPLVEEDDKKEQGSDNKFERHQIEAIKLVEEAIDEIPLPENQDDSPDDQSITSEKDQNQELQEEKPVNEEKLNSANDNIHEGTTTVLKEESKGKVQPKKSWSNLKKLILLRRFIKSLEKVSTFNPRETKHLPLEPNPEAEKVHLRHQDMDDRKNAEEWMLDYALQQVVAKLTPARKRKVELLVEAFETVVPTMGS